MNKLALKLVLVFLLSLFSNSFISQKKYWVKLKDKNGTPYTIANPSAFLSQKSIDRRVAFGIPVHYSDLPVTPSYISQVENVAGVTVLYASKWLNGLVISATNTLALNTIKTFSFVLDTSRVNRYKLDYQKAPNFRPSAEKNEITSSATSSGYNYGVSYWQNKQINVDCLHNQGLRGFGMCIAVLDAGFFNVDGNPLFDSIRNRGRILGTRDFVSGGNSVYDDDAHGMYVLSCMAAIKPGVMIGSAPDADYWLLRTEDTGSETLTEEYNWIRGAEFADSVGAHILTTSLGYTQFDNTVQNHTYSTLNGRTAPMSIAANMAARKGMFVLNAAGNEGASAWQYIGVPADADSICTVGAIDSLGLVASFSSIGPTFDGRTKPDLVARGVDTWVSSPTGQVFPGNGTSFATPVLAGAVACYWQAHRSFSNIKMLDTLRKTASNAALPNNSIGWGIPNMCAIPVGIKNLKLNDALGIKVFPNPFSSVLSIEFTDATNGLKQIQVLDVSGKVLYSEPITTSLSLYNLNLENLARGFYFVKLITSSATLTQKVIKSE